MAYQGLMNHQHLARHHHCVTKEEQNVSTVCRLQEVIQPNYIRWLSDARFEGRAEASEWFEDLQHIGSLGLKSGYW